MRRAGILAHPTALPGPGPLGDLGEGAVAFLDWMVEVGVGLWQVLPLHPTGGGLSPYDSPSAFAGGTHLISPHRLVEAGLLEARELVIPFHDGSRVSEAIVRDWQRPLVAEAARRLAEADPDALQRFAEAQPWVQDWALYQALLQAHGVTAWQDLPAPLARRDGRAMAAARKKHQAQVQTEIALQLLFWQQWGQLRSAAHSRGIRILGDVPIFVSGGSCDVWAGRERFKGIEENGRWHPDPIAGVPPDYFSPDGQLWGNPHYDWPAQAREGYAWWVARIRNLFSLVDEVRIDHFRGFVAAWEVARGAPDAKGGHWAAGPGKALFDQLRQELGPLPIFVEDLGEIGPEVHALRKDLGLPGMKILQFGFNGNPHHPFLPHNYDDRRWVVYTGTHDNDTSLGWYRSTDDLTRHRFRVYVARSGEEPHWDLLRMAWSSVADTAVTQLQDLLGLGSEARFNTPGVATGNWAWRALHLPDVHASARLAELTATFGRARPAPR